MMGAMLHEGRRGLNNWTQHVIRNGLSMNQNHLQQTLDQGWPKLSPGVHLPTHPSRSESTPRVLR